MSTLSEISSAADRLSLSEKEVLLVQLGAKVEAQRKDRASLHVVRNEKSAAKLQVEDNAAVLESRKDWMARLETLSKAISTGRHTTSTEKILEDLRAERF